MKNIKIKEEKLRLFVSQILNEVNYPTFGNGSNSIYYKPYIDSILKIENLHEDRYKDYELDEAWNSWKSTEFNKNSEEYIIYLSKFKNFMFGNGGFLRNISYVADRLNGPLHSLLLDPKWVTSLNGKPNWKYSDLNSGEGGDEFHCFYTTVLKLFQNPAIWNDFFFNPLFANEKSKYDNIRTKITSALKTNKEQYIQLLPINEYRQLNYFMNEINQDTKKIEKGMNCKPELFYNQDISDNGNFIDDDDEEF